MPSKETHVDQSPRYHTAAVEHIISDHAGTVLDSNVSDKTLSPHDETKAKEIYHYHDKNKTGLKVADLPRVLSDLDIRLNEDQFAQHVLSYISKNAIDSESETFSLPLFLDLVGHVFAPPSKFGSRLRKAAGRGDDEIVNDLVARGCTPLGTDGGGYNALHYAAQYDQTRTIDLLITLCSDTVDELLNATDNSGWSPLMVAAANGRAGALQKLLEKGAQKDIASEDGRTALHWAAAKGKNEIVEILTQSGMDVNQGDLSGWTPLHCAMLHGHIRTGALLVGGCGASSDTIDTVGNTPDAYCTPELWQGFLTETERLREEYANSKSKKVARKSRK